MLNAWVSAASGQQEIWVARLLCLGFLSYLTRSRLFEANKQGKEKKELAI